MCKISIPIRKKKTNIRINHNLMFSCNISSLVDGSMAWHSLHATKNDLKNLLQNPDLSLFPFLTCFLLLINPSLTKIPPLFLRESSRFRTAVGTGMICCHLWEDPYNCAMTTLLAKGVLVPVILLYNLLLSELSLELVLALLTLLLLLLVLLLLDDMRESWQLTLLALLVARYMLSIRSIVVGCCRRSTGKEWGNRRPLKKRWSAGEFLFGSQEGESGVKQPNSKSESWSRVPGVLGNEKMYSLELVFWWWF